MMPEAGFAKLLRKYNRNAEVETNQQEPALRPLSRGLAAHLFLNGAAVIVNANVF
jgi:hypothetical protein